MKFVGQLLGHHLMRYPLAQLDDVYKLLHQAALGAGHALDDTTVLQERLDAEVAAMGSGPEEPVADAISPDGRLARVHLRAYLEAGHSVQSLFDAFVQTAREYPPSPDKLVKFCGCLADLAGAGGIPFDPAEVSEYFAKIAEEMRSLYSLAYVSSNSQNDGKFREIRVVVGDPKGRVRARKGYFSQGK